MKYLFGEGFDEDRVQLGGKLTDLSRFSLKNSEKI